MENKITKGKWTRSAVNGFAIVSIDENDKLTLIGKTFFKSHDYKDSPEIDEALANAKLFEAAPLLLDSLLKLTSDEHIEQDLYEYFIKEAKTRISALAGN